MQTRSNTTLELLRFIAACSVVFLHCLFPGTLGYVVRACARFAVPFFFALSGYFSLNIGAEKIKARLWKMFRLALGTNLLFLVWNCINRGQVFWQYLAANYTPSRTAAVLLLSASAESGHLWYLSAIVVCYAVLYVYVRFFPDKVNYRPLYILSPALLTLFFLMDHVNRMADLPLNVALFRNGLVLGLPLFTLGLFIRDYQDRIFRQFSLSKGILLAAAGAGLLLSTLEYLAFGNIELPFGALLTAVSLLLFAVRYPRIPGWSGFSSLAVFGGKISLQLYIIHPLVYRIIGAYQDMVPAFSWVMQHRYKMPVIIFLLSLALSSAYQLLKAAVRSLRTGANA